VNRTLVRVGGVAIPSYPAMLYLGCVSGVLAGAAVAGDAGLEPGRFAATTVVLLVPALVGSRLLFVAQHLPDFRRDPARLWDRAGGGASLLGGLVLALAVSVGVLAAWDLPFWRYWDAAAVTMLVGLAWTRVGCVLNGCCAGRPTDGPLGVWLADVHGIKRRRWPTPLVEAGWACVVLAVVLPAGDAAPPGTVVAGVVAAYAATRLALEPTREHAALANVVLFAALLAAAGAALVLRL
jgi:phosphatidylglycerol---prolipoprotein diacylglyceryl transferase